MAGIEVSKEIDRYIAIEKQVRYGVVVALTAVAKEGQRASVSAIQGTYTVRGKWYLPGNRYGVRISPARKDRLESSVHTAADWLELHEEGGTKTPKGKVLAVPTDLVRRNKKQIITKSQRPRNLKRSFVLNLKSGPVLFVRKNTKTIVPLYNLEPKARIRKESTVLEPVEKVVRRRFGKIVAASIEKAMATAK